MNVSLQKPSMLAHKFWPIFNIQNLKTLKLLNGMLQNFAHYLLSVSATCWCIAIEDR